MTKIIPKNIVEFNGRSLTKTIHDINQKKVKRLLESDVAKGIRRQDDFRLYVIWRAMPPLVKGKTKDELEKLGIFDETIQSLAQFRTITEFCKEYKMSRESASQWEEKISVELNDHETNKFLANLTSNLMYKFYQSQISNPTPEGVKAWKQMVHNWAPNINFNVNTKVEHVIPEEEKKRLTKLLEINGYKRIREINI